MNANQAYRDQLERDKIRIKLNREKRRALKRELKPQYPRVKGVFVLLTVAGTVAYLVIYWPF